MRLIVACLVVAAMSVFHLSKNPPSKHAWVVKFSR